MRDDALHARLLQLFVDELEEHVQTMNADLLALEQDPADEERIRSLFRIAHTLKGAARAAGVTSLETACHRMEDQLAEIRDQRRRIEPDELESLYALADHLLAEGQRLRADSPPHDGEQDSVPPTAADTESAAGTPAQPQRVQQSPVADPGNGRERDPPAQPVPQTETRTIRIAPERLDDLLASTAEVLRLARRAEVRRQEVDALVDLAAQWNREWRRDLPRLAFSADRTGASDSEEDPLTRTAAHLRTLEEEVRSLARRATGDAIELSRVAAEITTDVRLLRMRPLRELTETLPRTIRDLAATAGKEVRLEVEGADVEVDRTVLDALREALIPIIRNAIDHGIETAEERDRVGKPREAEIRLGAELRSDRVSVIVADDGRGIDGDLLRKKYRAAGQRLPVDDVALGEALLAGGISSRSHASVISGRGVGLDIVRSVMTRVRGTARLEWEANVGTRVLLEFPPSLANLRALLVSAGAQTFALPTASVRRIVRIRPDSLSSVEGRAMLGDADGPIPVLSLARVLGPPLTEKPLSDSTPAVIMGNGRGRVAFVVDDVIAEEELILRPIPIGNRSLPLIAGAAVLGHGGVAPIIDGAALMEAAGNVTVAPMAPTRARPMSRPRTILVADDSLTTRTLEQSMLEAAGFVVRTATDGLDALRELQVGDVDLVVSDVEMPRLDGIRLCESIRASERFSQIPVVLVTARERPEDRTRGMEAGADAYLLKSSFDQEQLLATIEQLLGE